MRLEFKSKVEIVKEHSDHAPLFLARAAKKSPTVWSRFAEASEIAKGPLPVSDGQDENNRCNQHCDHK